MSLGDDIASIFEDVGVAYTILRSGGNITGEYLDYNDTRQVTKPFFIEHQMDVFVSYTSQLTVGDEIQFNTDGRKFFVMHLMEAVFENEITSKEAIIFRVNAQITVTRPTQTGTQWAPSTEWDPTETAVDALVDFQESSVRVDDNSSPVQDLLRREHLLYIPKTYDIKILDRVTVTGYTRGPGPAGALNLQVQTIDDFTYRGMSIIQTLEDARA